MTQEDKRILLKDISARLPYGVKVNVTYSNENASSFRQQVCVKGDNELTTNIIGLYQRNEIDIRPYLFPFSSMTEEHQKEEYNICAGYIIGYESNLIDFYNKYHYDYRGLIPMGVAIDATGKNIY